MATASSRSRLAPGSRLHGDTGWAARRPTGATSTQRWGKGLGLLLAMLALSILPGCTGFRASTSIPSDLAAGLPSDIAAAGVLVEQGPGDPTLAVSEAEAAALSEALGQPLAAPALDAAALDILLQPPDALAARAEALREIRSRLGHRFAAVAWRRTTPLPHSSSWNAIIVVPIPYIWLWFNWPIALSGETGVPHDERIVRIVDLERAAIVSESYRIERGRADQKPYSRRQLSDALTRQGWVQP